MGKEQRFPVDKEHAAAQRKRMDGLGKADITALFSGIARDLKDDEKQMLKVLRADVLPDTLDLPKAMEAWNEKGLGAGIFVRNQKDETQLKLAGYILPSNDDFVIFFNNGQVHKGETTEDTDTDYFTSSGAWYLNRDESTFNGNSALIPGETKVFLNSFAETGGLKLTLSRDRITDLAELIELKAAVDTSLRQIE